MLEIQNYEIPSCDDEELNIKRAKPLSFKVSFDNVKEIKAWLFIIPGLGGDSDENYKNHLAEYVAQNYPVAVVSVDYHCCGNRPQTGSSFYLDPIDKFIIKQACDSLSIKLSKDPQLLSSFEDMNESFQEIDINLARLKDEDKIAKNFFLDLSVTLQPKKDEYQNFGIMQALDCLNALLHLRKNPPSKMTSGGGVLPCIMLGSSHGGYLAHLCAKLAPWNVQAVVDNSCYAKFLWRLVGIGKEVDYTQYPCFGTREFFNHIHINCFDKTFWTINEHSPYFFSPSRRQIRYILNPEHLEIQSKFPKPKYRSYHSLYDKEIAPPDEKEELYRILNDLGFDAKLRMIRSLDEVDGKFIKDLSHGMGMSMKSFVNAELPFLLQTLKFNPYKGEKEIVYPTDEWIYCFKEENNKMILKCLENKH